MFREVLFFLLVFIFLSLIYEAGRLSGLSEAFAMCELVSYD